MKRTILLACLIPAGCAGPLKPGNKLTNGLYRMMPETLTVGGFHPADDTIRADDLLFSASLTWRLRPGPPPVPLP